MILRPYQTAAVEDVERQFTRPVLVAPTGSGKTVMGSTLVHRRGGRTLWLAHRRELITQAADSLRGYDLRCGILLGGERPDPTAPVQVGSIQTVARRDVGPVDLIVVDECHHAVAASYRHITDRYPGVPVLGLTATPYRLDGRGLGDLFDRIVVSAYPDELIDAGYLVQPEVYAPAAPDLHGVRKRAGDFALGEMAEAIKRQGITGNVVETWLRLARGLRTVVFCVNVPHAEEVVYRFRQVGVAAEKLDGKTPKAKRDAVLARLRSGQTQVVANCQILTEGTDIPELGCVSIVRPTESLCLHIQMIGRVMRTAPGKDRALVLDHAGNTARHGFVTERLRYSLDGEVVREASSAEQSVRNCPRCFYAFTGYPERCPACGEVIVKPVEAPKEAAGELVRVGGGASFEEQRSEWDRMLARATHPEAAETEFHKAFGRYPLVVDGQLIDPRRASMPVKQRVFAELHQQAKTRGYKPKWANVQYKARFGFWPGRGVMAGAGGAGA